MDISYPKLKEMWTQFAQTGEIDPEVKDYIADSWIRSKQYNVDMHHMAKIEIDEAEFMERCKKNKDLIMLAKPIMEYFCTALFNASAVISLSDPEKYILEMMGDKALLSRFGRAGFKMGACWSEEIVGTNALDLCLRLRRPIQTAGAEQYCEGHHAATGSGAPIHNEKGDIIGSINITSDMEIFSKYSLGMVSMGAKVIENQIVLLNAKAHLQNGFDAISECVIMTDSKLNINYVNRNMVVLSDLCEADLLGLNIKKIFSDINLDLTEQSKRLEARAYLNDQIIDCRGSISRITFNGEMMGMILVFRDEKAANKIINKQIGNIAKYSFKDIITNSPIMRATINEARKAASSDYSVLITGGTGTGKELFAQSIHNASSRARGPFVAINCAALPRDLVESELFGYVGGAFTGARKGGYSGKFEMAHGGTIFLDEIGEMPIEIQAKLLRVLDNHKIMRIGGEVERNVDVRVIAATNADLQREIDVNNFRLDLYYRLGVVSVKIPSLCERLDDIRPLVEYFIEQKNKEGDKKISHITDEFIATLEAHTWPGNVRELQNVISKAYYFCDNSVLDIEDLPNEIANRRAPDHKPQRNSIPVPAPTNDEREHIIKSIYLAEGNVTKAAEILGMSKATIYRKMKKYGIDGKKIWE